MYQVELKASKLVESLKINAHLKADHICGQQSLVKPLGMEVFMFNWTWL
jgi:hypothetical protein